jgi:hypothetical protein
MSVFIKISKVNGDQQLVVAGWDAGHVIAGIPCVGHAIAGGPVSAGQPSPRTESHSAFASKVD